MNAFYFFFIFLTIVFLTFSRFNPPAIPPDFEPHHKFPAPLEAKNEFAEPPPLEVSPPEDGSLRLLIEGCASLVARCELFEDISKEKHRNNPLFSFLTGGSGHDFYKRKLWEERQKRTDQRKQQVDMKSSLSVQKMTAESRGRILGERPLERSSKDSSSSGSSAEVVHLQYNLSDTFTNPASLVSVAHISSTSISCFCSTINRKLNTTHCLEAIPHHF